MVGALLLLTGCPSVTSGVVGGDPPKGFVDTTVGPGDVLEVRVYGEKDLTGLYRIEGDGTVVLPLIGKLKVGGKTPPDIGRRIARKLRKGYLRNPQVTVFVKEYNSKKITVYGQVKKPGTLRYSDNMTIVQAISEAGGFTDLADRDSTIVTRTQDGRPHRIRVRVKSIGQGREQNFVVRPGDVIWVPERLM
ncbi:MAG: polysaccharide biosynthesis/export family protein [bacterium]